MGNILTIGDRKFVLRMMRTWGIKRLNIDWSSSKKKYPDIWVKPGKVPVITVTAEWKSHNTDLRRSQLVHEFLHLVGYEHSRIGKYNYSTYPDKDTFSKAVYQRIAK